MVKLTDVTGVGPVTVKLLSEHEIKTVEALASISLAELQKIPGFGDLRARAIKKAAADCLQGEAAKQLTTLTGHPQTAIKKTASQKPAVKPTEVGLVANQALADKDKKKNKKDGKKKEKIKDKSNKQKGKDKDKGKKKDGKKKNKKKS